MEPQDQKSSPEPEVKPDLEIKAESESEQQPQQQQQHTSSVIMRRQVITTAGTIEDETKAEQLSPEENIIKTNDASAESSPQNEASQTVQYQEGREEQNRTTFDPERFNVATTEGYNHQNDYHGVPDGMQYTVQIPEDPHDIPITGGHYESTEDTKTQIIYANLESVSSPYANNQHYSTTDGVSYIQQQQYQNYSQHYPPRSPDDSPPSTLVHRNDPTLSSSRLYPVSLNFKIFH